MNIVELIIFIGSILILLIEKNFYIYILLFVILIDVLRLTYNSKKRKKSEYFEHLNSNNNNIFKSLLILLSGGLILISCQQFIALNYWKNALVNNTINKLFIFIFVIFLFFLLGPDGYFFDITFFKCYFYPSKMNVVKGILNRIRKIPPSDINSYSNFEIYRLFENLLITHERLNYEIIRIQGRVLFFTISAIGIIIFSFKWFIKILISAYFMQKYIVIKRIDNINKSRSIYSTKQHNIFKELNYVFDDIENLITEKKTRHIQTINKLITYENKLDLKIRGDERMPVTILRMWTFFVYSVIAIKVFFITNLPSGSKLGIAYATKLTIGAINVGWIGMNLANIYQSLAEISLRLGNYSSLINKLSISKRNLFLDSFNKYIKFDNNIIYFFNIPLEKKMVHITGKSGKGKTTLLNSMFYNHPLIFKKSIYFKQSSMTDTKNKTPIEIIIGFSDIVDIKIAEKCLNMVNNKLPINTQIINQSGGERQRLLFASKLYKIFLRKIQSGANSNMIKFFIIDEGDTNLDLNSYNKILQNILKEFINLQIIFTTHKSNLFTHDSIQTIDITSYV